MGASDGLLFPFFFLMTHPMVAPVATLTAGRAVVDLQTAGAQEKLAWPCFAAPARQILALVEGAWRTAAGRLRRCTRSSSSARPRRLG